MVYDIYKLSTEMEQIATKRAGDELREIANQLEIALNSFLSGCNDPTSIQSTYDTINHNDNSISSTCAKEDTFRGTNEETSKTSIQAAFMDDTKLCPI